ncbi:hypothetical protein BJ508DRAFT_313939 [Ascobolus immersus RN42]|uniref:F-box domain-containing protein n=1 Tax=Ascobolus immersus RN42 TaxID=1160509 RepID=A0A3N4HGW4_ASCIM|nr:hypothetical protein BJ508DRAFT_313939 [Ascobolus immersus RN42]
MDSDYAFLNLPPKIRLEVFSCCTTLSLLMLQGTCHQLRAEVKSRPSIIANSYGFSNTYYFITDKPINLIVHDINRVDKDEADFFVAKCCRFPDPKSPNYYKVEFDSPVNAKQLLCRCCLWLHSRSSFRYYIKAQEHFFYVWSYCDSCISALDMEAREYWLKQEDLTDDELQHILTKIPYRKSRDREGEMDSDELSNASSTDDAPAPV